MFKINQYQKMETVNFKVDKRYSKVANWFSANFDAILCISEVEDIINLIKDDDPLSYQVDLLSEYHGIEISTKSLKELKDLIKSLKK